MSALVRFVQGYRERSNYKHRWQFIRDGNINRAVLRRRGAESRWELFYQEERTPLSVLSVEDGKVVICWAWAWAWTWRERAHRTF